MTQPNSARLSMTQLDFAGLSWTQLDSPQFNINKLNQRFIILYSESQGGRNEIFLGEAQNFSPFFVQKSLKFLLCNPLNLGEA